ncbi:hypothetical protein B0T17DRAFT_594113 [Bombardia bombarda]|uniref:JmjC domain-containing protein n=1 Tax=Bombardia bombarda TaxID=252184 RepID=A0AA39TVB3_9PEZI|nr:hypothetical protein B0T17DRAFT_594113 [Bombardia bombarda]
MDALQGKVDYVDGQVREVADALRDYLNEGNTPTRKVKPPGTKAGRDLLQQLLGRLDQVVATDLALVRRLSTNLSPPLPQSSSSSAQEAPSSSKSELVTPVTPVTPDRPPSPPAFAPVQEHSHDSSPGEATHPLTAAAAPAITPVIISGLSGHTSPLFACTYQDMNVLNEELFEQFSRHPLVQERGYFKLQVQGLPVLNVPRKKIRKPTKHHVTSFRYNIDSNGLVKVDSATKHKITPPRLPLPSSTRLSWTLEDQRELWNTTAKDPPSGIRPYIIGNPLFTDVTLSPGEKLRQRGYGNLEGINTQYVYFNLTGKTITVMHREDAHVRSENLLRSGENKFWCFVKPSFTAKLEDIMRREYPEILELDCSQGLRHLSRHISPEQLDQWGIEYTLDYCVPGQAVVTEPGTYHQVLNLGPNYAIAINLEYLSSPDMPPNYKFCDESCPEEYPLTPEQFRFPPPESQYLLARLGPKSPVLESLVLQEQRSLPPGSGTTASAQSVNPQPPRPNTESRVEPEQEQHLPHTPESVPPQQTTKEDFFSFVGQQSNHVQARTNTTLAPSGTIGQPHPAGQHQQSADMGLVRITSHPTPIPAQADMPTSQCTTAQLLLPNVHEPTSIAKPPQPTTVLRLKRPTNTGLRRKSTKRQKVVGHAPVSESADGALVNLTTLIRGCQVTRAEAPPFNQICSALAFRRLAGLVRDWRDHSKHNAVPGGGMALIKYVDAEMQGGSELHVFLRRFSKVKLCEWHEGSVEQKARGRPSASDESTNELLAKLGWDDGQRDKLQDYLREGKCWETICGNFNGLLALMPSDTPESQVSDLAMFHDTLAQFQHQLDVPVIQKMCAMGEILQKTVWSDLELPEYIWESVDTAELTLDQLYPLLGRFRLIKTNHYYSGRHYWPRPTNWGWIWPIDPSSVRPYDPLCDYCNTDGPCSCLSTMVPDIPRISDDDSKGPGVRAVGMHRAGSVLGELVGELVPAGMGAHNCTWTMEFRRPDLDDELVAEIYPREMGNWVRKVNHSLSPSAVYKVLKISSKWRQMLVALRDIKDGEEITAKHGRGLARAQPYSLAEGSR